MKTILNISLLATLLVLRPEASSTGRAASASERLALANWGQPEVLDEQRDIVQGGHAGTDYRYIGPPAGRIRVFRVGERAYVLSVGYAEAAAGDAETAARAFLDSFRISTNSAAPAAPPTQSGKERAPLSPRNLNEWLDGKEVVELTFAGPHMEPLKLRDSLKTKVAPTDWDFRMMPGEGGGLNRSFVEVCMKVTPDNVQRLLALQTELESRGYLLEPQTAHIWSYGGNESAREKARRLVPDVLTAAERGIRQILAEAQFTQEKPHGKVALGKIRYEVPGTNVRGGIGVHEISAVKAWESAVPPDDVVHLPRLGLMITSHYQPGQPDDRAEGVSPKHASIRKSVREAVRPLIELETTSPATQPVPARLR